MLCKGAMSLRRDKKQVEVWGEVHDCIVEGLCAGRPISAIRLAKDCKVSRQTATKHLNELKQAKKARQTYMGWIWELDCLITPSEMRDLPEIELLREACENGSLLYAFNRPDFFKPQWKKTPVGLQEKPYQKTEILNGTKLGCIYVNIDPKSESGLFNEKIVWSLLQNQRQSFLETSPYFLTETITQFLKSRKLSEMGIDVRYFTGQKDIRKLRNTKIREMMRSVWEQISTVQVIYSIDVDALALWLETDSGKEALFRTVARPAVRDLARKIENEWRTGDEIKKRLR